MTTTPSDDWFAERVRAQWGDRDFYNAGLAAGRAEHAEFIRDGDQATALRIDSLVRENQELYAEAAEQAERLKREQEATDAAEQKLAALVEGLRAFVDAYPWPDGPELRPLRQLLQSTAPWEAKRGGWSAVAEPIQFTVAEGTSLDRTSAMEKEALARYIHEHWKAEPSDMKFYYQGVCINQDPREQAYRIAVSRWRAMCADEYDGVRRSRGIRLLTRWYITASAPGEAK